MYALQCNAKQCNACTQLSIRRWNSNWHTVRADNIFDRKHHKNCSLLAITNYVRTDGWTTIDASQFHKLHFHTKFVECAVCAAQHILFEIRYINKSDKCNLFDTFDYYYSNVVDGFYFRFCVKISTVTHLLVVGTLRNRMETLSIEKLYLTRSSPHSSGSEHAKIQEYKTESLIELDYSNVFQ